jgi:3-oxoacyl-[acyl-carrier-protein] synthase-3
VKLARETFDQGAAAFGWTSDSFDCLICHQVSASHTRKFREAIGFDDEILVKTFPVYGNMGPAAVPFTLDLACEAGLARAGDRIALMGIGSGLGCSIMEIVW